MAERLSDEAILPCLLDRLCDDRPEALREAGHRQSMTLAQFRDSVLRDLGRLLNTPCHLPDEEINRFPEVRTSVLNYGTPDVTGKTASTLNPRIFELQIAEAIRRFEPRILPRSVVVRIVPGAAGVSPNLIGFEIRGLLWANPIPEQFQLHTTLDLETGKCLT